MKNNIKKEEGFTIIEVLIVLAIAGLIMLIVFLAVPALQRNNRNTQRRTDVGNLLAGISDFATNNNGQLPNTIAITDGTATFTRTGCAGCSESEAKIAFFTAQGTAAGQVEMLGTYAARGPFDTPTNDRVALVISAACDGPNSGETTPGAARQFVAIFSAETGSNSFAGQCQES